MHIDFQTLTPEGHCPKCGPDAAILLAEDYTYYTRVYKDPDDKADPWCFDERDPQKIDSFGLDGTPTTRLYCTQCGDYFHIPDDLEV